MGRNRTRPGEPSAYLDRIIRQTVNSLSSPRSKRTKDSDARRRRRFAGGRATDLKPSHTLLADSWILRYVYFSVLPDPRLDRNELRYVTRDAALQYRAVPPDHVLGENFRLIRLRDDCTEKQRRENTLSIPSREGEGVGYDETLLFLVRTVGNRVYFLGKGVLIPRRARWDGSLTLGWFALPPPFDRRQTGVDRKRIVTTCHFELLLRRACRGGRREQGGGETKDGNSSTVIVGRLEGRPVASHPGIDRHEFRDEAGYSALQDGCVSAYHVLGHDLRLVVLSDDWWKRKLRSVALL